MTKGWGIDSIISYILAYACYNNAMFLVGILSWWYGRGWSSQWRQVTDRWRATVQFFSIGQLLSTLFSPFRQISAAQGAATNPAAAMRAFVDQLISRLIGAFVRFFTILAGTVIILFQIIFGVITMTFWLIIPLLPVVGFILLAIGWAL